MKKSIKHTLIIILTTSFLLVSLFVVQAKYFRGGNDTYFNVDNVCGEGITFNVAINASAQPTVGVTGILLQTGGNILTDSILLDNVPVEIPGRGWVNWSAQVTGTWSTPLQPGSRVKLVLEATEVVPVYVTVENCSLTDSPDAIESTIFPDPTGSIVVPPNILQFPGTPPACISSTMQVSLDQPVGDLNLAMWIDQWNSLSDQTPISATLTSPTGTKVQLIKGAGGDYSGFGTRCEEDPNDLMHDPLPNFILDDDSAYQFIDVTAPYTGTAVHPFEALNTFRGENATGTWTLDICNSAPMPEGKLNCWYLEFDEAGTVSGHMYLDSDGDGVQTAGEPDLANVNVIVTDSEKQVQVATSDASGNWSAVVPPGNTSTAVDSGDPDFPAGSTQTEGTNPTTVNVVTGAVVSAGNDGFYLPPVAAVDELFLPVLFR